MQRRSPSPVPIVSDLASRAKEMLTIASMMLSYFTELYY
jgi:hypothetical protein